MSYDRIKKKYSIKTFLSRCGGAAVGKRGAGSIYRPLLAKEKINVSNSFSSQYTLSDYWQLCFWFSSQLLFLIQLLSPSPFHLGDRSFSHLLLLVSSPLIPLSQPPSGFILCPSWSQAMVSQVLFGAWLWGSRGQDTLLSSPAEMELQFPPAPLLLIRPRAHFLHDTAINWLHLKWQQGS